ncbi:hypothetical protein NLJ89_g2373 [Agrocybe chaxingu]|uniref:Uncharacterized protein n=1 Tax=Agrocybe chaxingu TaxID=84603 RepID=A0A9W8K615_9AGAR|nr:hypothetical protein NLJ89_g2373 [Agrocybe chaxingu]
MVATSYITSIKDFLVKGLISLAIVFATIRAHFAKVAAGLESAGLSVLFVYCLCLTLGAFICVSISRGYWCQRSSTSGDEESGSGVGAEERTAEGRLRARFRLGVLPVIFHGRKAASGRGRRSSRGSRRKSGAIRLEEAAEGVFGTLLFKQG